jgi:uncharacterized protein YoaH (UPF0181 family)
MLDIAAVCYNADQTIRPFHPIMNDALFRTGDVISLDGFHRELLAAMLDEAVPKTMTVAQAKALVERVEELSAQGMEYHFVLKEFIGEVRELTRL